MCVGYGPGWVKQWWKERQAERASPVPLADITCSGCGKKRAAEALGEGPYTGTTLAKLAGFG